jgi:Asp-tRNA(Asn)/Glu-tRNA(Gln) amidotransferase A subunit family amidase
MHTVARLVALALGGVLLASAASPSGRPSAQVPTAVGRTDAPAPVRFDVHEATIAQIHDAMRGGHLTCRALVTQYLRRIETFDKNGPALNAIVVTNPDALATADALDQRFARSGPVGPLHCVPMIVKDNFETVGMQSANGSLSLEGFVSRKDAFQVARIKAAGAIVLAKSNMAEWAFTPYETVSSILPGYTKNPYALDRVTAGSSGGTAAAVAASFGTVGLGTDTGNSIRGPSSHQALVGIRSTMGLTSRGGVMPLSLLADIAGPMARTVEDAVRVFQVIVGSDPDDPATAPADAHLPQDYLKALDRDGLKGARIGVLRAAFDSATTDAEVLRVFDRALADLRAAGATIIDPVPVPALTTQQSPAAADTCRSFKYEINRYLASHGDRVPVTSLAQVLASRRFHPSVRRQLERAAEVPEHGPDSEACRADTAWRQHVRNAVTAAMDAQRLDAFVYPTWSHPPRLIGDLNTPHGDNSQFFSPETGFPAIQVPMGYTRGDVLPAGLTLFGRAWSEPTLIRLAFAYEQATRHRRAPTSTPPLR